MKKLIVLISSTMLMACGGSGGGSGNGAHAVDSTPHDYTAQFAALTNTSMIHTGTLHQVCNFGDPSVRDESTMLTLQDPSITGGIGCAAAKNYTMTAENTGTQDLYLSISVDGVNEPDVLVAAGATYTFQRGY